jgi:4-amino-4-deoxy-L-arabinose transferase-like glycosyltransferase
LPPLKKLSTFGVQFLLALATFCLLNYHLGTMSLQETSEGRYGSVARTMVESGSWLTPELNGLKHFTKPPLTYWLSALGMKFFGISEAAAKWFLPIIGAGTVLGCYQIGLLLFHARAALTSAFVLLSSTFFLALFRGLTADPLLTFLETWMVWGLLSWIKTEKSHCAKVFWVCAGLAMLTKGPPGLIPLLGLFPALWYLGEGGALKKLFQDTVGLAAFFLTGFGWYLAVCLQNKGLLSYFLLDETLHRVASGVHQRTQPWYFFLLVMLIGAFPWTPFLIETLWDSARRLRSDPKFHRVVLLAWFFIPFCLFSLASSKLAPYILPLMVPASLIIGEFLARRLHLAEDEPFAFQMGAALSVITLAMLGLVAIYVSLTEVIVHPILNKLTLFIALQFIFLAVFGYIFMNLRIGKGIIMVFGIAVPGILFFTLPYVEGHEELTKGSYLNGVRPLLQRVAKLPPGALVVNVEEMLESIPFYTNRVIPTWEVTRETRFEPELAKTRALFGPETLRALATDSLYLLVRRKDLATTTRAVGRELIPVETCGMWGLYSLGQFASFPAILPPPEPTATGGESIAGLPASSASSVASTATSTSSTGASWPSPLPVAGVPERIAVTPAASSAPLLATASATGKAPESRLTALRAIPALPSGPTPPKFFQ